MGLAASQTRFMLLLGRQKARDGFDNLQKDDKQGSVKKKHNTSYNAPDIIPDFSIDTQFFKVTDV